MVKTTCIVCDQKIDSKKGAKIIRCIVCDNTVHPEHTRECFECKQEVCMNDVKFLDQQEFCKNCVKKGLPKRL